ncbi:phosphatidylinositol glycan anchor biosynthesis class B [Calliopsis andreniformis]|uniref:phosphatidylinositol glycan anchor biosynthesis class B n=1 Tax=Calliopsis andreniformis TaxID=337506 RepID=UPI003FCE5B7D
MQISKKNKALSFLILWRFVSVFFVQTADVPDEYWQSLEVAHRLAFGYGYLTWEWITKIRSYIYPFLIHIIYQILAFISLDYVWMLTTIPRIFQAIISAYGEYRFYKWTNNKWTLYSLCINWYWYYCATRTLMNTIETACTMIALSVFPWRDSNNKDINFLWIVGFMCMIRPTAAIIWLPLCLYHLCTSLQNKLTLIGQYCIVGIVCCLCSTLLDIYCYGTLVFSPWEFFRVNILHKIGDAYGTHHLLWYIFCGLPVLLGLYYPVFLLCCWQIIKYSANFHRQAILLIVIAWTLCIYSLLSHKEFRFLLPLLPMIIYICTSCTFRLNIKHTKIARKICIIFIIITNLIPAIYFCMIHQRGSLDVTKILQKELVYSDNATSLLFLTPCHAIPLYSHLHVNVPTRILTCEPNLNNSANYVDEAEIFFANPVEWLTQNYDNNTALPSHIITFNNTAAKIKSFLTRYQLRYEVFHTHFPQSNYGEFIHLYKRK